LIKGAKLLFLNHFRKISSFGRLSEAYHYVPIEY